MSNEQLKEQLIRDLQDLPGLLDKHQQEILALKRSHDDKVSVAKMKEFSTVFAVKNDKEFKNDVQRQAEIDKRLAMDAEHAALLNDIKTAKRELEERALAIELYANKFRAARSLANLIGSDCE